MRMNLLSLAGLAVALGVVACGSASLSSFDTTNGAGGASDSADGGTGNGLGPGMGGDGDAGVTGSTVSEGSVVLVHASRNLPAFRVCFSGFTQTLPLPDDKIMPNANVVGVDIGTAVHIGKLDTAGTSSGDASVPVYDAGEAGASAPQSGDLSVIEEKLARQFFPQGTDASTWPNCQELTQVLTQNGYEGHGLYTLKGSALSPNSTLATFVIVKGCVPDAVLTTKECGTTFTAAKGNLSYDTLEVAAQDGTDFDFKGVTASPAVADGTLLYFTQKPTNAQASAITLRSAMVSSSTSIPLPPDTTDYSLSNFELRDPKNLSTVLLTQSLADIQARSAPRELPDSFFALRSTFVLFAIGDPAVNKIDPTASTALHLLAIPVQDPGKIDPDGGAL